MVRFGLGARYGATFALVLAAAACNPDTHALGGMEKQTATLRYIVTPNRSPSSHPIRFHTKKNHCHGKVAGRAIDFSYYIFMQIMHAYKHVQICRYFPNRSSGSLHRMMMMQALSIVNTKRATDKSLASPGAEQSMKCKNSTTLPIRQTACACRRYGKRWSLVRGIHFFPGSRYVWNSQQAAMWPEHGGHIVNRKNKSQLCDVKIYETT